MTPHLWQNCHRFWKRLTSRLSRSQSHRSRPRQGSRPQVEVLENRLVLNGQSLTANERFVQALYNNYLGRDGTLQELDAWVSHLPAGQAAGVANGIGRSHEAHTRMVDGYYASILGRSADHAGERYWTDVLDHGTTAEHVMAAMFASDEYHQHAVTAEPYSRDAAFVTALYQQILGRSPTASEVGAWRQVETISGREAVAQGFLGSDEWRGQIVHGFYENLLGRNGSAAEVAAWVHTGQDIATMEIGFMGSVEFFQHPHSPALDQPTPVNDSSSSASGWSGSSSQNNGGPSSSSDDLGLALALMLLGSGSSSSADIGSGNGSPSGNDWYFEGPLHGLLSLDGLGSSSSSGYGNYSSVDPFSTMNWNYLQQNQSQFEPFGL